MTHSHKLTGKQLISRASFCFGNLGHSAFYGVMSTYFIIFVTSGMFAGLSKTVANKLIGLITGLIVSVRILELLIDPLLGNIVDIIGFFLPFYLLLFSLRLIFSTHFLMFHIGEWCPL